MVYDNILLSTVEWRQNMMVKFCSEIFRQPAQVVHAPPKFLIFIFMV